MKNEKKKDVLIGVLIAIVFILLAVLIALSISEKTKKNDPNDDVKNSTSTTTTAETSENETEAAAIEKELNDYIKNNPTPLEIKYGLTRKITVKYVSIDADNAGPWDEIYEGFTYLLEYHYNNKFIAYGYFDYDENTSLNDIKNYLKDDYIHIETFKDLKSDQKYHLVCDISVIKQDYLDFYVSYGLLPDIYSSDFVKKEFLSKSEITNEYTYITYKNGTHLLDGGKLFQINNNKVRYYSLFDEKNDSQTVLIQDLYFENGELKKEIVKKMPVSEVELHDLKS